MAPKPPKPTDRVASPRHKKRKRAGVDLLEAIYPTGGSDTLSALLREAVTDDDKITLESPPHLTSHRSFAIISSARAERALERTLIAHFPKLDAYTFEMLASRAGPLSSFFSKIHLAFALGLLDSKTRNNLEIIRKIRNVFAHAPKAVSFQTSLIVKECHKLTVSKPADTTSQTFGLACVDAVNFLIDQLEKEIKRRAASPSKS
jgi:DNA-binding MltR family transcriptional regulator